MFKTLRFNRHVKLLIRTGAKRGKVNDAEVSTCLGAIRALGGSRDSRAVDPLVSCLPRSFGVPPLREAAVTALGELGDGRAVDPLVSKLQESGELTQIRTAAATALGRLGDERAVEPLIGNLVAKDPEIRKAVSGALALLGQSQWQGWIRGDEADFDRLGESDDPSVVELYIRTLSNTKTFKLNHVEVSIWLGAIRALGRSRDPRALDPLVRCLARSFGVPPPLREAAVTALGELGDGRAVDPLVSKLQESVELTQIRTAAATALGRLGDERAVEPLIGNLVAKDPEIRKAVSGALALLGQPQWQGWIRGDEADFDRLGESDDPSAVELLRSRPTPSGRPAASTEYFEVDVGHGDGLCSDNGCPCPEVSIPRGTGYLYIEQGLVDFRAQFPAVEDARKYMERQMADMQRRAALRGSVFAGGYRLGPVLVCEQGATRRNLDLEVAAADAKRWWETGKVPLRPTPVAAAAERQEEVHPSPFACILIFKGPPAPPSPNWYTSQVVDELHRQRKLEKGDLSQTLIKLTVTDRFLSNEEAGTLARQTALGDGVEIAPDDMNFWGFEDGEGHIGKVVYCYRESIPGSY